MICNFSNWDRKWIPYQGTEWRPTQSPFPWGSWPALGSCLGVGVEPGLAGLALPVSSWGPDRNPPCRGPSLCCWGHRTSHTQAAPSTGNTSADLNSFGLKKEDRENKDEMCIVILTGVIMALHFKNFKKSIFIWWWILTVRPVNNLQGCCFKDFILSRIMLW